MSKVKELADAETRRVAAEQPPEPDADQDAPEPDTDEPGDTPTPEPPAQPDQEVNAEAQGRAFFQEMERHASEWAHIARVPVESLEACPTCEGAGFLDRPLKVSEHHQRCEACNGYGVVISGSLNAQSATTQCTECQGYGHRPKVDAMPVPTPIANGNVTPAAPVVADDPPEVLALRRAGYTVVPPITFQT